jgi:Tfp pilus assembly pilus retraction ATPase PilT
MGESTPPRIELAEFLRLAAERGATTVLYLVGRPPVMRIGRDLQPPLQSAPLTFRETQALAEQLLSPAELQFMEEHGNVEATFEVGGVKGHLSAFYGLGSHNLVFYIEEVVGRTEDAAAG